MKAKKRRKIRKKPLIISIIIITIIIIILSFIIYESKQKITLNGKKELFLEVNTEYKEQGVKVTGSNKKYTTTGKVNINKLGTYKITYKLDQLLTKKVTRTINVVDTTAPVLTLEKDTITLYINDEYTEPGYSATDNYDKDITKKVKVDSNVDATKAGEYKITYTSTDSSNNTTKKERKVIVKEKVIQQSSGLTYIKGILIVNKKYSIPSNYNPGIDNTAYLALTNLQNAAKNVGYNIPLVSGFRSYSRQVTLYNNYVAKDGQALADTYSARPGHSKHQTGLAFDVGKIDDNYGNTPEGIWLYNNCHKYGFILRYPQGKTNITGYKYEPWHIRYVGVEHATNIYNQNITLEEYLGIA